MTLLTYGSGEAVEVNIRSFASASFVAASLVETAQPVEPPIPQTPPEQPQEQPPEQPAQPEIPAPEQPNTQPGPDTVPSEPPAPAAPQPADPVQSPPRMTLRF